ncbi:MAG: hypothetical protein RIQ51_905 [Bacteroidota bacterium]
MTIHINSNSSPNDLDKELKKLSESKKNSNSLAQFVPQTLLSQPLTNEIIYKALILGVRDYVNKNHFRLPIR